MVKKEFFITALFVVFLIIAVSIIAVKWPNMHNNSVLINHHKNETYAFVSKTSNSQYMNKVYDGFKEAAAELGVQTTYVTPDSADAEEQIKLIDNLVKENITGIAVSANDRDALENSLKNAMKKGIPVISLDSAVNPYSRYVHIEQADIEQVGSELAEAVYDITGGAGGVGILSTTEQATNQNLWIESFNQIIHDNQKKFSGIFIAETVYGYDDYEKSYEAARRLIQNRDVSIILSPTTVGISSAAKAVAESGSEIKVTGLGLPSEMAPYIKNGICPYMYLWNPEDIGYLSVYTIDGIKHRTIAGKDNDKLKAGKLGIRFVRKSKSDNGTEIILSQLFRFDANNIDDWKNLY